jgi:hypothetical protein
MAERKSQVVVTVRAPAIHLAGQNVGMTQVGERIWLVTFMRYDLGYFDDETWRLEPIENPLPSGDTSKLKRSSFGRSRNRRDVFVCRSMIVDATA